MSLTIACVWSKLTQLLPILFHKKATASILKTNGPFPNINLIILKMTKELGFAQNQNQFGQDCKRKFTYLGPFSVETFVIIKRSCPYNIRNINYFYQA